MPTPSTDPAQARPARDDAAALLRDALASVVDPQAGRDIVALGLVRSAEASDGRVRVVVESGADEAAKDALRAQVRRAVAARLGDAAGSIEVEVVPPFEKPGEAARRGASPLPLVDRVVAVGAGKGGVGKSTVAVLLATGLARLDGAGRRVGLLDADIYGPSMPTMLGLGETPAQTRGSMLLPFQVHGIRATTIGRLVDPDKALIWRGPMAHGAVKQLAMQTDWGPLDELLVDLPPGTGDVPLTLAQLLPLAGAVVVCTPQRVAQDDARRAIRMFQQLGVELLGVVENMSGFTAPDGSVHEPFGRGGAEKLAQATGVPFLGALPLHPLVRIALDEGDPLRCWRDDAKLGATLDALCRTLLGRLDVAHLGGRLDGPTLTIR